MSKMDIKFELLDLFNEEEISTVCKNVDLNLFLILIKNKRYAKYAKTLGRLERKSALVQKFLPGIAFNLYKKGEEPFRAAVATQLEEYREDFVEIISKGMKPPICIDDVKEYDAKAMADFYFKILDISATDISFELFLIFLKLQNITIDENTRQSIEKEIDIVLECRHLVEKHKIELRDALKEQEKKLSTEFEYQKQELRKQIEATKALNKEIQGKLYDAEQRLQEYEKMTQDERTRLEEEWLSDYEKELESRKTADEIQWKKISDEVEAKHQELMSAFEEEAEKKSAELEVKYQEQLKNSEEMLNSKLAELTLQVARLVEKKNVLDAQINCLEQRKQELDGYIRELGDIEEKYFETFEQRIIKRKIDTLIFQKFEKHSDKENTSVSVANALNTIVVPAKALSENTEYGEEVSNLEDFFDDYKANISLNFDNETEIAGIVLAGVLNGMGIVASDKVCNYLSEALAALLDLSSPLVINSDSEKENLKNLVDIISISASQVVCIKGVLDNYNEILLTRICEVCKGKYLFFSISNLENLKMMSRAMMNYAIVIDAENELHFPADDCILIGDHDLSPFIPKLDMKKSQEIYKKTFNRLVVNKYIKKSTAIEYSNLMQLYFTFVNGTLLGEIVQKSIICACDFCFDDENLNDLLNKCGITVSIEQVSAYGK